MNHTRKVHVYGVCLTILALLTVSTSAFEQYEAHQAAVCQAHFNQQFVSALQARSDISDSDRHNLTVLVQGVFNAGIDNAKRLEALHSYIAQEAQNDRDRAANPLPSLPGNPHC